MDYEKSIEELRRAWDALEEMSVRGYQARARITLAQEMILSCYNALAKAKKETEKEDVSEIPGDEKE
jgi:hypothetical protein